MKECFNDILSYPLVNELQQCISDILNDICTYSKENPLHDRHVFEESNQNRCTDFILSHQHAIKKDPKCYVCCYNNRGIAHFFAFVSSFWTL